MDKKEFEGLYQFSKRVSPIWKKHAEDFSGTYQIVNSFVKKDPVYRDDYIEPYGFKYTDFVTIQDIETKVEYDLELAYFNNMFTFKVKETKVFNDRLSVLEFLNNNGISSYNVYKINDVYELDIYE